MDCDCKSVFNRLSKGDRLKLRGAALTKALSGFVRDDTDIHPWRYPFYAAYLVVIATPLPFPFAATLTIAATLGWARYSKSGLATRLNGRLKEAFNHAAMVWDHKDYIYKEEASPETWRVKNAALAWHTTKRSYEDTRQATVSAWKALKTFIMR